MKRIVSVLAGVFVLYSGATTALPAQTYTTLHSFDCSRDGAYPDGTLVQDTDGYLYGTTAGGANIGAGTIFKITPGGALTTIYKFCTPGGICPQNISPRAPLLQASNGKLYGSTFGSAELASFPGAVFEIADGRVKTLHSFCSRSECQDGASPNAALIQTADGNLYGTTEFGGAVCYLPDGCGTVFKMTPSGALTTLYSFCKSPGCSDGAFPLGALVRDDNGYFYGTTYQGGSHGGGTLFKITPSGTLTTLDVLCDGSGPCNYEPEVGMVMASDGDFYGIASSGGTSAYGTIFKMTPSGKLTTIYSFCSQAGCADGETPIAALIQGTDGYLYGSTGAGGPNGLGTIFKTTLDGTLTTLYGEGATTLMQDTNGDFYGTIARGGNLGCGTVFRLSVGLGPFVETEPASGKVGAVVRILGSDLTGVSSVAFNGTPAGFNAVSRTNITATVPVGATTGLVEVVTSGGTLSSNVPFRVMP
jgi:uncharacterized repeat protein (TIGR03803 family)